ncbi:MAG: diaminopimelate epimerase [Bacteroidetes bacterium]|nr:diaminopimelate epimerase [Bacteroidota bacterium]
MKIEFSKYQGTGNDFIIINNFENSINHNSNLAIKLCNRHFGIGSDGLIIIEKHKKFDFDMVFYNPDGNQSFCGNGSRCAVKYAFDNNIINNLDTIFNSTDGVHKGNISNKIIEIEMKNPQFLKIPIKIDEKIIYADLINTGSPHLILHYKTIEEIELLNVPQTGAKWRYTKEFAEKGGVNVNFISEIDNSKIYLRTYERGVENETLSCGTGVTAAAISYHSKCLKNIMKNNIEVKTLGGILNVKFDYTENLYENIRLCGPSEFVFSGKIDI